MKTLLIEAGPGTGKTSTLLQAVNQHFGERVSGFSPSREQQAIFDWFKTNCPENPPKDEVVFLAYNKAIAVELEEEVVYGTASTLHSLGSKLCRRFGGKMKLNKYRTSNVIQREMGVKKWKDLSDDQKTIINEVTNVVSAAKDFALSPDQITIPRINRLVTERELGNMEVSSSVLSKYTKAVLSECLENQTEYDFDDMLYLPIMNDWKTKFQIMLIDECQDLSPGKLKFVLQQDCQCCIFVGDANQAIYAFAGADSQSMLKIKKTTSADSLPLSISWRCPRKVVELAKESITTGTLSSNETAEDGVIETLSEDSLVEAFADHPEALLLCRTNAPLIAMAWKALKSGSPVKLLGRSLESGVASLLKGEERIDYSEIPSRATIKIEKQIEKIQNRPYDTSMQVAALQDKLICFLFLYEQSDSIKEMKANIRKLFRAESSILGCSIHKSKGLEAKSVFWLHPELCPHPMAKTPTAKAQEKNLRFVATTRTKRNLFFIPKPKQED